MQYFAVLCRQAFFGKPVNAWGYDKDFHFLVEADTLQDVIDICVKQCAQFNAQLPEGHRFVAGPIREDPDAELIQRLKPETLTDPDPGTKLRHARHPLWYIDLDDESRFHPGDKTGAGLRIQVLYNSDNGQAAYQSAADGRLYMTSGADRNRTIKKERLEMISGSFPYSPVMFAWNEDGSINWDDTIPDVTHLSLSKMWLEGQAHMD